jgi:pyruvoyl-dependent arginine decarboxylase (PvlArgDC)
LFAKTQHQLIVVCEPLTDGSTSLSAALPKPDGGEILTCVPAKTVVYLAATHLHAALPSGWCQAAIRALREGVAAEHERRVAEKAAEAANKAALKVALEEQMKLNATRK